MELATIVQLLTELEKCQSTRPSGTITLEDFRIFLNEQAYQRENPENLTEKYELDVNDLENQIAKQVIMLGRYSKHLIKKSLDKHPELVNEDFTYLYRMMDYDSLTKMQLIDKNAHEKQTGIEIIKRLVKHGLLAEKPDTKDKRSTRISVTAKGRELFNASMKDITTVSKVMCGRLSEKEKEDLLRMLKELNTFHHTIYTTRRTEDPAEFLSLLGSEN